MLFFLCLNIVKLVRELPTLANQLPCFKRFNTGQLWSNQTVHNSRRTLQSWIYLAEERLDAVGIANTLHSRPPFLFFTSFLFFSTEVPIEEEVLQLVEQKREDTRLQSDQQFVAVAVLG